ncbi:dUTP diphosphatase [Gudongella sp. SC589]|uniref:dUTP diphosphatase n=1 Tax=Gudongella sp. SC589 TaxID=3385990 RepID=UPI003904C9A0
MINKLKRLLRPTMRIKHEGQGPTYANENAAGLDIRAANENPIMIQPGEWADIPTELAVEIPEGYFGMVVPRSGLGFKYRLTLINDVGIIDSDYRGNIGIRLLNEGTEPYMVLGGERVAQMIITPYTQVRLVRVASLTDSERGSKGFGSTGRV